MSQEFTLPRDPASATLARRLSKAALEVWRLDREITDTAVLLVSELVTNAIRYGGSPVELALRLSEGRLRVEVSDGSPEAPSPRDVDLRRAGGRGLSIVSQLAQRWGSAPSATGAGKTVWFELVALFRT